MQELLMPIAGALLIFLGFLVWSLLQQQVESSRHRNRNPPRRTNRHQGEAGGGGGDCDGSSGTLWMA